MTKIEINRYFASPEAFYKYCANKLKDHEGWIPESFEFFKEPLQRSNYRDNTEVCKLQPFECHFYYKGSFNFIMEYDFYDDTHGFGYLYLWEV